MTALASRADAADLIMNGGTITLGGVHDYGTVSLTNNARIIVPPFDGIDRTNTGNLVIHADSINIDATSRITAKGAGYQGKLCVNGSGPATSPLSGGRGGCALKSCRSIGFKVRRRSKFISNFDLGDVRRVD